MRQEKNFFSRRCSDCWLCSAAGGEKKSFLASLYDFPVRDVLLVSCFYHRKVIGKTIGKLFQGNCETTQGIRGEGLEILSKLTRVMLQHARDCLSLFNTFETYCALTWVKSNVLSL